MADEIKHGSVNIINASAKVTDAALPDSGDAGTYTSTNQQYFYIPCIAIR